MNVYPAWTWPSLGSGCDGKMMGMHALPLSLAALGAGYYAFTAFQKPALESDPAYERWKEHMTGARFALGFGLGAGAMLFVAEKMTFQPGRRPILPGRSSLPPSLRGR